MRMTSEMAAEAASLSRIGTMILRETKPLAVRWIENEELGYTSLSPVEVSVAWQHKLFDSLSTAKKKVFRMGVFGHELLHRVLTNFTYSNGLCESMGEERASLFMLFANTLEDPAIEHFAPDVFGGTLLDALNFSIRTIYKNSSPIGDEPCALYQLINALILFGDMGRVKGKFTFKEAKRFYKKILPLYNEGIECPDSKKRLDVAMQCFEICRPLWEDFIKNNEKEMNDLKQQMGNERRRKRSATGDGTPMKDDPNEPSETSKVTERRRRIVERLKKASDGQEKDAEANGKSEKDETKDGKSGDDKSGNGKTDKDEAKDGKSGSGNSDKDDAKDGKSGSGKSDKNDAKDGKSDSGKSDKDDAKDGKSDKDDAKDGKSDKDDAKDGKSGSGNSDKDNAKDSKSGSGNSDKDNAKDSKSGSDKSKGEPGGMPNYEKDGDDNDDCLVDPDDDESEDETVDMEKLIQEVEKMLANGQMGAEPTITANELDNFDITSAHMRKRVRCKNDVLAYENGDEEAYKYLTSKYAWDIRCLAKSLEKVFDSDRESCSRATSGTYNIMRGSIGTSAKIFDKRREKGKKKDTAVFLAVDNSGSMYSDNKILAAQKASVVFAEALTALQVPYYIMGFTADSSVEVEHVHYVTWENTRKSRYSLSRMHSMWNNNDGYSIRYATEVLKKHSATNKILFVISDGLPACSSYSSRGSGVQDTKLAIKEATKSVNVFGIGLGADCEPQVLQSMYGRNFIQCADANMLTQSLCKQLEKVFKNGI